LMLQRAHKADDITLSISCDTDHYITLSISCDTDHYITLSISCDTDHYITLSISCDTDHLILQRPPLNTSREEEVWTAPETAPEV